MPYISSTLGCCSDLSHTCDTWCCFPCQVGRQCNAIAGVPNQHSCGNCIIGLFCAPFMGCCLRCKVSDKYQLEEGCLVSCLCGTLCAPCSVCMTGRELAVRGTTPGGFCCGPSSAVTMA